MSRKGKLQQAQPLQRLARLQTEHEAGASVKQSTRGQGHTEVEMEDPAVGTHDLGAVLKAYERVLERKHAKGVVSAEPSDGAAQQAADKPTVRTPA